MRIISSGSIEGRPMALENGASPASTRRVRQTDQSIAAGAVPAHAVPMKIRRTTRPDGLAVPHHRLPPSRRDARLYCVRQAVLQHNLPIPAVLENRGSDPKAVAT